MLDALYESDIQIRDRIVPDEIAVFYAIEWERANMFHKHKHFENMQLYNLIWCFIDMSEVVWKLLFYLYEVYNINLAEIS